MNSGGRSNMRDSLGCHWCGITLKLYATGEGHPSGMPEAEHDGGPAGGGVFMIAEGAMALSQLFYVRWDAGEMGKYGEWLRRRDSRPIWGEVMSDAMAA